MCPCCWPPMSITSFIAFRQQHVIGVHQPAENDENPICLSKIQAELLEIVACSISRRSSVLDALGLRNAVSDEITLMRFFGSRKVYDVRRPSPNSSRFKHEIMRTPTV